MLFGICAFSIALYLRRGVPRNNNVSALEPHLVRAVVGVVFEIVGGARPMHGGVMFGHVGTPFTRRRAPGPGPRRFLRDLRGLPRAVPCLQLRQDRRAPPATAAGASWL